MAIADRLKYPCKQCGADVGDPCVYVWPKGISAHGYRRTAKVQALIDRVGKPTQNPHNERDPLAYARNRRWEAQKILDRKLYERHGFGIEGAHQLFAWLSVNADIFDLEER